MSTNRDDDTSLTLMMRVQKNPADHQAWDEFVRRYQPVICAWCLKWGAQPSDADDVAQEVLLKLLTAMRKFQYDPARSFRAWLRTVTHNAWNDFVTSNRFKSAGNDDRFDAIADSDDALADLEKNMEDAFDRELLELAMLRIEKRVKPTTWQAFRLTAIENRSGVEVAQQLQIPVASVFVAKHRVQKLLQEEVRSLKENPS
jgi:RNA polymerase sigma-70 factor (ECF subfamily)